MRSGNFMLAFAAVLALCGCSPKVIRQEVMVACVRSTDIPEQPALRHDTLSEKFPMHVLYGSALTDKTALEVYSAKLRVLVQSCSTLPAGVSH